MSKIVEYIIVADIFVRSKSGFEEVSAFVSGLAFATGDWAAVAGVELEDSAIVFLLEEMKIMEKRSIKSVLLRICCVIVGLDPTICTGL